MPPLTSFLATDRQPLVLPAMLLGTIVGFNLLRQAILASSRGYANGIFVPPNLHGWFLEAVASDKLWHSWTAASFTHVDWQVLLGQLGASIVLVVVVVITLLLNIICLVALFTAGSPPSASQKPRRGQDAKLLGESHLGLRSPKKGVRARI